MFKYKPDKLKNQTKITTLDEVHRNYVKKFEDAHSQLGNKSKILKEYHVSLNKLNDIDQATLTNTDVKNKVILKNKIDALEKEINDVSHYKSELDYYNSVDNILSCYYDVLNNSSRLDISEISPCSRKPVRKRTKNLQPVSNNILCFFKQQSQNKSESPTKLSPNALPKNRVLLYNQYMQVI